MNSSGISYVPRPDATPEGELDALAAVYAYILRCGDARRAEKKKATRPGGPDDAEEPKNDRTAELDYSR
jgi:hypothetical protein